jgi:hypothetical protein
VRVCPDCIAAYDRDFLERLRLLAPQVLENDEPVSARVCLACGRTGVRGPWRRASKWVDAAGRPVRRATFHLCRDHADAVYVDGIVVASNLAGRMGEVLAELPPVAGDLLERIEGWRPERGSGPAGTEGFRGNLSAAEAALEADDFWSAPPETLEARAAWLGPVRKDYGLRYRLDMVCDRRGGRRDGLVIVRTAPDRLAAYRYSTCLPKEATVGAASRS